MSLARSILIAACVVAGLVAGVAHADNGILGDANCDSAVDVLDAQAILQYTAEFIPALTCPVNADVNGNGHAGAVDALLILQLDAGLIHGF